MDKKENNIRIENDKEKQQMNCWEALSNIVGSICLTICVVAFLMTRFG